MVALLGSSGAWAQCTDNFNTAGVNVPGPGDISPVSTLLPLGTGSSLSALISQINTINTAFTTQTSAFVSAPGGPQADQQGSGAWGRVVGGTVETKSTSTGTVVGATGIPATGTQTCNTTVRTNYTGYQFGHDIAVLNGGNTGANWHFGVTAGFFQAKAKDLTPGSTYFNPNVLGGVILTTPPGAFTGESEVPFFGVYTAFTKGGFFADGQVRVDYYQNSLTDPNNGLFGQSLNAQGLSLTANAGYNFPVHSNWFVEPSAGVVWSRVQIDPLSVAGQQQVGGAFPFARGLVQIDDIDSLLGRATVRVGTNFTSGHMAWQPFFTASVFHEFAGNVGARSTEAATGNVGIDGIVLTTSTDRIGTYAQLGVGTAAAILNTGWLGYARFDYRTGENIEGWGVNAGLRYQFSPDQYTRATTWSDPTRAAYNWTGPYVGVHVGALAANGGWGFVGGGAVQPDFAGYLIGGQAGFNVQTGKFVVGIEGEYSHSNAGGGVACPPDPPPLNFPFRTCEAEANQLVMVTGRVGTTWGRALFYGKAGLAAGEVTASTALNPGVPIVVIGVPPVAVALPAPVATTNWQIGWTAGIGMEFALTDRWSAKAEYMYFDLGSDRYQVSAAPEFADVGTSGNLVRVGLNYHFHHQPAPAPLK